MLFEKRNYMSQYGQKNYDITQIRLNTVNIANIKNKMNMGEYCEYYWNGDC